MNDQKFDLGKALQSDRINWEAHAREQKSTAARRLALLRTCEKELLECPYCDAEAHLDGRYDESLIITHADDCELAKELSDD